MIYYLLDFLINNTILFKSTTILINLNNYSKKEFLYILFIDIFINKIPLISIILLLLRYLNKILDKKFVSSLVVENIIYIINYFIFIIIIYLVNIKHFEMKNLLYLITINFFINYFLFWVFRSSKKSFYLLTKSSKMSKINL